LVKWIYSKSNCFDSGVCIPQNEQPSSTDWSNIVFPMVKRVVAKTLAGGGYVESDERIKRRKRIKKLERILDEEQFQEVISKDEYDDIMIEKKDVYEQGLISVQPLSAPTGTLFYYMDFKYETDAEKKRKERQKKMERIIKGN